MIIPTGAGVSGIVDGLCRSGSSIFFELGNRIKRSRALAGNHEPVPCAYRYAPTDEGPGELLAKHDLRLHGSCAP